MKVGYVREVRFFKATPKDENNLPSTFVQSFLKRYRCVTFFPKSTYLSNCAKPTDRRLDVITTQP